MSFGIFQMAGPVPPAPGLWSWQSLMRLALAEARHAAAHGDVPVGALVVSRHGQILSLAGNQVERDSDPTAHAEILALRRACLLAGEPRLEGCVLVATLEPCLMCAGAIFLSRLVGIVYGAADSRAGAVASANDYLALPGDTQKIWHMGGVLGAECASLLNTFFTTLRGGSRKYGN